MNGGTTPKRAWKLRPTPPDAVIAQLPSSLRKRPCNFPQPTSSAPLPKPKRRLPKAHPPWRQRQRLPQPFPVPSSASTGGKPSGSGAVDATGTCKRAGAASTSRRAIRCPAYMGSGTAVSTRRDERSPSPHAPARYDFRPPLSPKCRSVASTAAAQTRATSGYSSGRNEKPSRCRRTLRAPALVEAARQYSEFRFVCAATGTFPDAPSWPRTTTAPRTVTPAAEGVAAAA